jgi:AcrR family transcriptional regulator
MTLWDRHKERRRRHILDTAAELIAREGLAGLSMRKLAEEAEVSVATLYNLCGGREEILWSLIVDRFGRLGEVLRNVPEDRPIERMRSIVTATARHLESDSRLGRPVVMAAIEHGPKPGTPVLFVAAAFIEGVRAAIRAGLLQDCLNAEVLGGHILRSYVHAMQAWARGFLSSDAFEAVVLYGLYEALLGVATEAARPSFLDELKKLEPEILGLHRRLFSPERPAGASDERPISQGRTEDVETLQNRRRDGRRRHDPHEPSGSAAPS